MDGRKVGCQKCGAIYGIGEDHACYDPINPSYYTQHPSGVECITITRHFNFNLGNVIKYLWRAPLKDATLEDLKKARWYLDDEIKKIGTDSAQATVIEATDFYKRKF